MPAQTQKRSKGRKTIRPKTQKDLLACEVLTNFGRDTTRRGIVVAVAHSSFSHEASNTFIGAVAFDTSVPSGVYTIAENYGRVSLSRYIHALIQAKYFKVHPGYHQFRADL